MGVVNRNEYLLAMYGRLRQLARYAVGRVTGTVPSTDGRYKFFIEQAESRLFHRAELNAIGGLLLKKGLVTETEWQEALEKEMAQTLKERQAEFPECVPADDGRSFHLDVKGFEKRCREENWPK